MGVVTCGYGGEPTVLVLLHEEAEAGEDDAGQEDQHHEQTQLPKTITFNSLLKGQSYEIFISICSSSYISYIVHINVCIYISLKESPFLRV
jgi:hypothetical protein